MITIFKTKYKGLLLSFINFHKKRLIIFFLSLIIASNVNSQKKDAITELANSAMKSFSWDVEKAEKGSIMFLDVPYQEDNKETFEYLTLTVAKNKSKLRPDFISIIIPSNISISNGIFVAFTKTNNSGLPELDKDGPNRIRFEKCSEEKKTCTARIIDGFSSDEETSEKTDILQKFLDFDEAVFMLVYPNGSHKSIFVPLESFKRQYKEIEANDISLLNSQKKVIIPNPISLDYEYFKLSKLADGSSVNSYIEKGKSLNTDGDYAWSKMIPTYASSEIKYTFEYQMDFTDQDMDACITWLMDTLGDTVGVKSVDNPSWYNENMKLIEIFKYCKNNTKNITISYYNKTTKSLVLVVIDAGSKLTNTLPEIALVYSIFKI